MLEIALGFAGVVTAVVAGLIASSAESKGGLSGLLRRIGSGSTMDSELRGAAVTGAGKLDGDGGTDSTTGEFRFLVRKDKEGRFVAIVSTDPDTEVIGSGQTPDEAGRDALAKLFDGEPNPVP